MNEFQCPYCGGEMRHVATNWSDAEYYECKGCKSRSPSANCMNVKEAALARKSVPVVRCRECKHWSGRNDKPGEVTVIGYCDHPNHYIMPLRADWFCADGAKMVGGRDEKD